MPSSQSSSSVFKSRSFWIGIVTWLLRFLTGALFIYSGFVKAIDVWGTVYKVQEYLATLGINIYYNLVLTGVFILCAVEFMVGVFLVLGCYRKSSAIVALLFMCFMLPLTLWIAIANPVADCGCFGDAWILSNWATFWKNVIIMVAVVWLVRFNTHIPCIITPAFQWMAFLASALFVFSIGWYGYMIQPMIDFRPFPVGTTLVPDDDTDDSPQYAFTYRKDGVDREFSADSIPDESDGWEFVSRRELPLPDNTGKAAERHDFRVLDKNGTEDVTDALFTGEGRKLLLLIPSLKDISASTTYKINMLFDWAEAHDMTMAAVIASHTGDLPEWEDLSMPRYDIYTTDDTAIKELARGNPSVVYLDNDIIKWKSTLAALDEDRFAEPDARVSVMSMAPDTAGSLLQLVWIYCGILAALVLISSVPRLAHRFRFLGAKKLKLEPGDLRRRRHSASASKETVNANRDDKAHPSE